MSESLNIGVWDDDTARAVRIQHVVEGILRKRGIRGYVTVNCEPPQLSRSMLQGRFPTLEIAGMYWALTPGRDISEAQMDNLVRHLIQQGLITEQ